MKRNGTTEAKMTTKPNYAAIDALGDLACKAAMQAGCTWLLTNRPGETRDYERITACIKKHLKAAFQEALDDAKQALDAGMGHAAEQTFLASCRLAGINGVKEAVGA